MILPVWVSQRTLQARPRADREIGGLICRTPFEMAEKSMGLPGVKRPYLDVHGT